MKKLALMLCSGLVAVSLRAQTIPLAELRGPDRTVHDASYGLSFVAPAGWEVRGGSRWGDAEATLFFEVASAGNVTAAIYYQHYYAAFAPEAGFAAWLQAEAGRKARLRVRDDGLTDYVNRPVGEAVRTNGEAASLSWVADFTQAGGKWCELLTHVVAPTGHALVFVKVPAEKITEVQSAYDALVNTVRLAPAGVLQSLHPRVLEGRRLHQQKDYAKALAAFTEAFQSEPVRAADLVAGAASAAMAGDREVALRWLEKAVAKGWNMASRLVNNPDLAALRETDGWKQLLKTLQGRSQLVETVTDKPLQTKLLAILDEDQKYRRQIGEVEKKFGRDSKELRELWATIKEKDAGNLAQVRAILDERGWVGPETVGRQANGALFLVIQHSDHATQLKYLPMMREAVKSGRAVASSLALLEDRVALADGRKQIYGSQISRDNASGKYFVLALEDPEHVDERRASVGLPPLAEYVKHWDITWDVAVYKAQQPK